MKSGWSDRDAAQARGQWAGASLSNEDVALRVYSSRLLGSEPGLVLHGGGNTSVKTVLPDDLGQPTRVLCVKGSGWDLRAIEPAGLPAVRLETLAGLRALSSLSDEDMVNAARVRLLDGSAPNPSVETLLHAFLPHTFIDHSHADAILALVDQPHAERICAEVFGDTLAIVPYVMPGFALAKLAAEVWEAHRGAQGLLLLQHGLFTYGDTARESYERHIAAVTKAESHIRTVRSSRTLRTTTRPDVIWAELAPALRGQLGQGGNRYILHVRRSDQIRRFVDREDLRDVAGRGPATPDHVIRTKPRPVIVEPGRVRDSIDAYRRGYRAYFGTQSGNKGVRRAELDPDPRVVLVPGLGIVGVGASEPEARVAADLYEHTVGVIEDAETVGTYQALTDDHLFDMEYWSLEQAKLGKKTPRRLEGRVVYITGAASGIGRATAEAFAGAGASLYLVDAEVGVGEVAEALGCPHRVVDVSDRAAVEASVTAAVDAFGGLCGVVSNAGFAAQSLIADCDPELLRRSFDVNFFGHQWVAAAAYRVLEAQGMGGFLLFNASKAAFNPGPEFGPYALPKAAVVALTKQYALEGGRHGIRANAVNADRIRTGLLDEEDVEARARARGLDTDAYYRSNLLGREVRAQDVAEAFVALALSECTTGSVFTVDGGNIAASPR